MNESTVSVKYMLDRICNIQKMANKQEMLLGLSELAVELARNYKLDTGHDIWEEV